MPFSCDRCGKTMATEGGFTVHLASHVAQVGSSQEEFDRQAVLAQTRLRHAHTVRSQPAPVATLPDEPHGHSHDHAHEAPAAPSPKPSPISTAGDGERWSGRPVQAFFLRAFVTAVPIVAAVVASIGISHLLPYPTNFAIVVLWWIGVFATSTLVMMVVDKWARKLLPLATLLKLSMLFPDQAPSRFGVALKSGTVKGLEQKLEEVRLHGVDDEPSRAARQILELVGMLGTHDPRTRGHSERVRAFTALLADQMKLPQADKDRIHWAALLHDVGKVMVPPEILHKEGKPNAEEWARLHRHPEDGDRLAAPLRPWLGEWADAILQHHEQYDGSGYPAGLKGEEISMAARIVAVADAFEVMTATRSYKSSIDVKSAREELIRCSGTHFDPEVVRAFLNLGMNRLRWTAGPLAWLAQLPFLQGISGGFPAQIAATGARVVASVAVFAGVSAPSAPPPKVEAQGPGVAIPSGATAAPAGKSGHKSGKSSGPSASRHLVAGNDPLPGGTTDGGTTDTSDPQHLVAGNDPQPSSTPTTSASKSTPTTTAPVVTVPYRPPTAHDDSLTTSSHSPKTIDVTANDTDPGSSWQYPITILSQPAAPVHANLSGGHTVNVVPNNAAPGLYSFTYKVCDTAGACSTATVRITVTP